jgi:predicted RNase H-like HicB family nuclease
MQHTISAFIRPGEQPGFVAECPELSAVTQGASLDEVVANLREVVGLALDGEDLAQLGFAANPVIVVSMELEPAVASKPALVVR